MRLNGIVAAMLICVSGAWAQAPVVGTPVGIVAGNPQELFARMRIIETAGETPYWEPQAGDSMNVFYLEAEKMARRVALYMHVEGQPTAPPPGSWFANTNTIDNYYSRRGAMPDDIYRAIEPNGPDLKGKDNGFLGKRLHYCTSRSTLFGSNSSWSKNVDVYLYYSNEQLVGIVAKLPGVTKILRTENFKDLVDTRISR